MKENYQKQLEDILERGEIKGKTLFLHACCAPCSSYVLVYLRKYFRITVFYYNPNITFGEEYAKRVTEQKRLIEALNREAGKEDFPIAFQEGPYEPERFLQCIKGLEACPEGGERCFLCYRLRLSEAAKRGAKDGFAFFTTTLTISPLKCAETLNQIGRQEGARAGVSFLPSDFKKKEGYKHSVALSEKYGLYRQDYCGCVYSKKERDMKNDKNAG